MEKKRTFVSRLVQLPMELWQNRKLIWKLSKNDFKKRYAGSYMGVVWGFAQPLVTVLMYYLVFDKIFGTKAIELRSGVEVPFALFITAGLVPWFFFSEALSQGTMSLIEYSYLVKKVVFKISILPVIKVIAATFSHLFFLGLAILLGCIYGYYPSLYLLQVVYYAVCLFLLVLAMSYTTCAVVIFFRDLSQIIAICLQIGIWATPILWSLDAIHNPVVVTLLKLNPLVYIVNGYRESVYGHHWFFEDIPGTLYFWGITVALFLLGAAIFKKLKVHFADVI
ncbi:MAG: ABC transporter permease [Lachnospiraceae bacterium]|nr:ABC transporter permease [Lachnospiraceae bacterium]